VLQDMAQEDDAHMVTETRAIDWKNISQADGDAAHVPDALRGLVSFDPEERETSYWKLDNFIILQGGIYEASFYAIPFLLEITKSSAEHGKDRAYDLLTEIANGWEAENASCMYFGEMMSLTDACKRSISDAYEVFLREVANTKSNLREKALDLLISLDFHRISIFEALKKLEIENSLFGRKLDLVISEMKAEGWAEN
jgi:hypothetical protein